MVTVEQTERVRIDRLTLGPFGTNCYILTCKKTGQIVLVDAPGQPGKILEAVEGTRPKYILITHGHWDHVAALAELKSTLTVPVAAHEADAPELPVQPDLLLHNGKVLSIGAIDLAVSHTPGHTPGSLCFLAGDYLIAGDTLFPGGPGRTLSPAHFRQILESITQKIFTLPDHTKVYPGHGEATTVREAKQLYRSFSERSHHPDLCGDVVWIEADSAAE